MVDFKSQLNEAQFSAVSCLEGPLLVIAGAGSGKTRVIEYRVLRLVREGVAPRSILLLTFTREAARRMLERAACHDPRCREVDGGTFHSFGYRLLRKYHDYAGLPGSFSVLDEDDASEAIKRCLGPGASDPAERKFPKKDTIRNIISASVNKSLSVEDILARDYPHFFVHAAEITRLGLKYAEYKKKNGYVDFDDILVLMKDLLEKKEIREAFVSSYKFIMVDEFQDTNKLQGEITRLLGSAHGNVMVVGDDAQSIYGFRGATHRNIMSFSEYYHGCKVIKLQENYRSTQPILDLANAILVNMENKYAKSLISARPAGADSRPSFLLFQDAYDEAAWIVSRIEKAVASGKSPREQAVLFRSAYVSIPVQAELGKRNIPFQVFGGMKFYEAAHVKDIVSYLRVIHNPQDELAWRRVLKLIDGVGDKTADRLLEELKPYRDIEHINTGVLRSASLKGKLRDSLEKLSFLFSKAVDESDLASRFDLLLEYYGPAFRAKFDDWHLRNSDMIAIREMIAHSVSMDELLASFAIDPPQRLDPSGGANQEVVLSTVHSAKGLEWDDVYLIGMHDGTFPSQFSFEKSEEMEEECRLFYVAVTRARENLCMSFHRENTRSMINPFNRISRFMDMPGVSECIDREDVLPSSVRRGYSRNPGYNVEKSSQFLLDERMFDFLDDGVF